MVKKSPELKVVADNTLPYLSHLAEESEWTSIDTIILKAYSYGVAQGLKARDSDKK